MIKEIEGTNLVAVKVAPDACNYKFGKWIFGEKIHPKDLFYDTEENIWNVGNEILPKGEYKIVGEVRKDKVGFDVEPYVNCISANLELWENYNHVPNFLEYQTKTKEESFYSRLAANGLYFENPIPNTNGLNPREIKNFSVLYSQWKDFEDELVKGKLLIIEKIK